MSSKTRVSVDSQVNFSQFLPFSGVQGAANAFIQVTIPTNVTPEGGYILELEEVVVSLDGISAVNTFAPTIDYTLTRASKAAIPVLTDLDIIAKGKVASLGAGALAAGSTGLFESPINLQFTGRQIIASTSVYFQFTSASFVTAMSFSGRIYYKQVPMAKDRILEVLYG